MKQIFSIKTLFALAAILFCSTAMQAQEPDDDSDLYVSLGFGTLTDNMFDGTATVEILQSLYDSSIFRIKRPYDGITNAEGEEYLGSETMDIMLPKPGDVFNGVTITYEDLAILLYDVNTGYHHASYDADIWLLYPARFASMNSEDYWLYNEVLTYQDNGLPNEIQLAPFYYMFDVGGWNHTQRNGLISIKFPGYLDLSLNAVKKDVVTDAEGQEWQQVEVSMGEDVTEVRYAAVKGDYQQLYEDILQGTADVQVATASGNVSVPLTDTGAYSFLFVGFRNDRKVSSKVITVYFQSAKDVEQFEACGTGTYNGLSNYWDEPLMSSLTFSRCATDASLFRISRDEHSGMTFRWNQETNECQVEVQPTGQTYAAYGDILVADIPNWYNGVLTYDDYPSYYDAEAKTFHFNVAYYSMTGYFAYGEETFVLDNEYIVGIKEAAVSPEGATPPYSLSGQRLAAPKKGINIVGGRKVVVK